MIHNTEKDIIKAQKWLQALGSKVKVTGKMTIGLSAALCAFQRRNSMKVTGELDKETWKALKRANSWWNKRKLKKLNSETSKINQNGSTL